MRLKLNARETARVTPDAWEKLGLVGAEALARAVEHQRARKISLEGALVELGLVTERAALEAMSRPFGGHVMIASQLEHLSISPDLLRLVPQATSSRLRALPFDLDARGRLWVLSGNPLEPEGMRQLQGLTRASTVQWVAALPEAIEHTSRRAYLALQATSLSESGEDLWSSAVPTIPEEPTEVPLKRRPSPLVALPVGSVGAPTRAVEPPPSALTELDPPRLGAVLDGRWRLEAELGRGGAATVYRASSQVPGPRTAAVKVLLPSLARDPVAVARFEREARALSQVSHPNLVILYAVGRAGALPYFAMELLAGRPLSVRQREEPPVSLLEVLHITTAVASALEALHAKGLVHRDVKPANVFLGPGGKVTLLDLGAAFERGDPGLTRPNHWIGTPAYMAPEQLLSQPVDARADVYSLGALAFELLVGFPPFRASGPDVLNLARHALPPPDASQLSPIVPRAAGRALMVALARNPQDRFQTPGALANALRESLTGDQDALSMEDDESTEALPRSDVPTPQATKDDLPWRKR
ncbi:MAG TPA: protein kinase [Myxococcales bacterium]|nr:protein kinase [Myxococcales bacterium]